MHATGTEHVPETGGFLLAANHVSNFDPWPLAMTLFPRRQLRFMAKSELYVFPLSLFLKGVGAFPVRRDARDLAAIDQAVQLCRDGGGVVVFPEGTRRPKTAARSYVGRAHTGSARIALAAGVPILPAAIAGTDRLGKLGPLHVAYGEPIPAEGRPKPLTGDDDGRDRATAGDAVSAAPLLVVDGDSFAHRAYHGLPKTIKRAGGRPGGALVGFANMLLRLWESERPRTVLVAWDTLFVPTYRLEALPGYQGGREFDEAILEQLELLPDLVGAFQLRVAAKGAGYEADDFLAAGAVSEEARGGQALRRDLRPRRVPARPSEQTTILSPVRGVSELRRIGPAEVREQYGIEPAQVPDFIALRGDPSDKIPGARGVGAKTAATILGQYGSLEAAIEAGRFAAEAEDLRLYRRIATLDASAPLPELPDLVPHVGRRRPPRPRSWAWALSPDGSRRPVDRARNAPGAGAAAPDRAASGVAGPAGGAARGARRAVARGGAPRPTRTSCAATPRAHVELVRSVDHMTMLDADTVCSETSYEAALLAAGAAIEAARRGGFALVRPPGHHALRDRAMGFCIFNNIAVAARVAQRELGCERVAIVDWDVHHGNGTEAIFAGDDSVLTISLHQWPFYPGGGGPDDQAATTVNVPLAASSGGDAEYAAAFERIVEPAVRAFEPDLLLVSAGFDAHEADPLAGMNVTADGFRSMAARCTTLGAARSRGARGRLQPGDAADARPRRPRRVRLLNGDGRLTGRPSPGRNRGLCATATRESLREARSSVDAVFVGAAGSASGPWVNRLPHGEGSLAPR